LKRITKILQIEGNGGYNKVRPQISITEEKGEKVGSITSSLPKKRLSGSGSQLGQQIGVRGGRGLSTVM